jgi:hypothetical protein
MIYEVENNKLIACFMGYTTQRTGEGDMIISPNGKWAVDSYPNYDSWNELMPVIDKVEKLGFDTKFTVVGEFYNEGKDRHLYLDLIITNNDYCFHRRHGRDCSKIEIFYLCLIEFIKWYNDYKTTNPTI